MCSKLVSVNLLELLRSKQPILIQAPLAGVSAAPFRELIWQFGGPAYCVTEMISAKTLLAHASKRFLYKAPNEGPLCFQLSGSDPDELKQAAIIARKAGANLIDLNCGCPVTKIRKKGAGSKLLSESQKLYDIIKAIKSEVNIPLSLKIRVDGISGDAFNQDVVKIINDAGADFMIVHGRHWTERYDVPARLDEIAMIKAASSIPVIGNGDVRDYDSLKKMLATGVDGAMIGRASVGRPWIFQELLAAMRGEVYALPSIAKMGALFLKHIEGLRDLENEKLAVLQARSLSKYYLRAAGVAPEVHRQFIGIIAWAELEKLVFHIFV